MRKKFNIKKFLKEGKNIVIDLEEVEYLLRDRGVEALERGDKKIPLMQLYDGQTYLIDAEEVKNSLLKNGVDDYLDKRV